MRRIYLVALLSLFGCPQQLGTTGGTEVLIVNFCYPEPNPLFEALCQTDNKCFLGRARIQAETERLFAEGWTHHGQVAAHDGCSSNLFRR